jgi:hypothetical protein
MRGADVYGMDSWQVSSRKVCYVGGVKNSLHQMYGLELYTASGKPIRVSVHLLRHVTALCGVDKMPYKFFSKDVLAALDRFQAQTNPSLDRSNLDHAARLCFPAIHGLIVIIGPLTAHVHTSRTCHSYHSFASRHPSTGYWSFRHFH